MTYPASPFSVRTGAAWWGSAWVVNHPERFARVVISNTGLPYNPDVPEEIVRQIEDFRANQPTPSLIEMQKALSTMDAGGHPAQKFAYWQKWCWETEDLPIGFVMSMMLQPPAKPVQALKFLLNRLGVTSPLPTQIAKAYDAPFPDPELQDGPARHAQSGAYTADFSVTGSPAQGLGILLRLR